MSSGNFGTGREVSDDELFGEPLPPRRRPVRTEERGQGRGRGRQTETETETDLSKERESILLRRQRSKYVKSGCDDVGIERANNGVAGVGRGSGRLDVSDRSRTGTTGPKRGRVRGRGDNDDEASAMVVEVESERSVTEEEILKDKQGMSAQEVMDDMVQLTGEHRLHVDGVPSLSQLSARGVRNEALAGRVGLVGLGRCVGAYQFQLLAWPGLSTRVLKRYDDALAKPSTGNATGYGHTTGVEVSNALWAYFVKRHLDTHHLPQGCKIWRHVHERRERSLQRSVQRMKTASVTGMDGRSVSGDSERNVSVDRGSHSGLKQHPPQTPQSQRKIKRMGLYQQQIQQQQLQLHRRRFVQLNRAHANTSDDSIGSVGAGGSNGNVSAIQRLREQHHKRRRRR